MLQHPLLSSDHMTHFRHGSMDLKLRVYLAQLHALVIERSKRPEGLASYRSVRIGSQSASLFDPIIDFGLVWGHGHLHNCCNLQYNTLLSRQLFVLKLTRSASYQRTEFEDSLIERSVMFFAMNAAVERQ